MHSVPFKSMGMKRALLIAVWSVPGSDLPNLDLAHRDARQLRDHLINAFGFESDDVILMIDDKHHPEHLWPTRDRILHQIDQLTYDALEGSHFFFYFSGHGLEEECSDRASMRADGLDDEIVCADGQPILDYILHDRLITPLEKVKGSKLFALFDCCHSETLLDLQRGRGPNSYSRIWNIGPDQLFKGLSLAIVTLLQLSKRHRREGGAPIPRRRSTFWASEPGSEIETVSELDVICLSACRDGQLAHDDCARGLTFTKCFIDTMAQKPNMTWTELRDALRGLVWEIRKRYEEVFLQDSEYWAQEPMFSTSSHMDLTQAVLSML